VGVPGRVGLDEDEQGRSVMAISAARRELIDGVKAHALAHYTHGGWDVIVECWSDEQIFDATRKCRTVSGAVKELSTVVDVYADQQADAKNSAF
jgi:hypothetical protein